MDLNAEKDVCCDKCGNKMCVDCSRKIECDGDSCNSKLFVCIQCIDGTNNEIMCEYCDYDYCF